MVANATGVSRRRRESRRARARHGGCRAMAQPARRSRDRIECEGRYDAFARSPDRRRSMRPLRDSRRRSHRRFEAALGSPSRIRCCIPRASRSMRSEGAGSSVAFEQRRVVAVERDGTSHDFVRPAADGVAGVFGMAVDSVARRLWVSTTVLPRMEGFTAADSGRVGVYGYDLDTGRLVRKAWMPRDSSVVAHVRRRRGRAERRRVRLGQPGAVDCRASASAAIRSSVSSPPAVSFAAGDGDHARRRDNVRRRLLTRAPSCRSRELAS